MEAFPAETRILVVDDMTMMRSLIKGQLRSMGFNSFFDAETGEKAIQILQDQHQGGNPIELVLSDWTMPGMSGLDLLKKVRGFPSFRELPFIMITAEGDANQVKEAIDACVSNYVRKPFTPATLQEKITAVLRKCGKVA